MEINADFSKRAVLTPDLQHWLPSPSEGVHRKLLDRIGEEVARATSIVRYTAGSSFDAHTHELGEEFYVLEGVFSDDKGHYPAGSYVRNPPGSSHTPYSEHGCTIFVKLRQMDPGDKTKVCINTMTAPFRPGLVDGLEVLPLFEGPHEHVALVRWAPETVFQRHQHRGGEEIFVLDGVFSDEHGDYPAGSWIRSPDGSVHSPFTKEGCLIYVKTGHLLPAQIWNNPKIVPG